ncbi:hypothetical protein MA16_Dca019844 [Dendrobium catenatum]|uniref:Uncharacterized protein n=1 Tax=Dendrobium catenatum TaxID=906689 RepID=A0A2I0X6S7_9ASPA|nr:hypothetical protein MA16_Dca019844 [Dendrobium catenatum]
MAEIRMKAEEGAVTPANPEERALNPFAEPGWRELVETPRDNSESGGNLPEKKKVEDRREIFRALEVVERNSSAIAESYASLFSTLRLALSEVTGNSVENMQCFSDVVGSLQVSYILGTAPSKFSAQLSTGCSKQRKSIYQFMLKIERRIEEHGKSCFGTVSM